jgi:hypothetical protein
MSFLFGSDKKQETTAAPTLTPLPAQKSAAEMDAEATATAKAAELERRKRAKGMKATILTSSEGDTSTPTLLTKEALGA